MSRTFGNRQKHENTNPIQRALIVRFYRVLAQVIRKLEPREILDVGCGEGYTLEALRKQGLTCPMHGIDLSENAIALARNRVPEATFKINEATTAAEDLKCVYDLVLITEVLEHIDDPGRMLPVLDRLAGRYVVASVPWEPFFRGLNFLRGKHVFAIGDDPEHVNHWNRSEFICFMRQRFTVRYTPFVFPWTIVATEKLRLP